MISDKCEYSNFDEIDRPEFGAMEKHSEKNNDEVRELDFQSLIIKHVETEEKTFFPADISIKNILEFHEIDGSVHIVADYLAKQYLLQKQKNILKGKTRVSIVMKKDRSKLLPIINLRKSQ